jgi:calcium/proton exchanger cax
MPQLSIQVTICIITVFTILVGICATFTVDSIDGITQHTLLTQNFFGLILLPHLSLNLNAVVLAREDNLNYSFAITIGGSIQVLALLLPSTVLIDWGGDLTE